MSTPVSDVTVDDVDFRSLFEKTKYVVDTSDGWSLVITRYRPKPQAFPQPLLGEPMLLVHGFGQNRHTWTSGELVKNLLFFGLDLHLLELRGHGKSSVEFQKERSSRFGRHPPADLRWAWDIDSYFLYDIPAAVAGVKRITRRDRIFYCGHSMGGMLGYGYAGIHDDFEGIVTIGAAADLGRGALPLKLLAFAAPGLSAAVDSALVAENVRRTATYAADQVLSRLRGGGTSQRASWLRYEYVPLDAWLKVASDVLDYTENSPWLRRIANRVNPLAKRDRAARNAMRWLLREGGEREPRKVVEQFLRWIREDELVCYRTGYDFKRGFEKIKVPIAIIFGDRDPIASVASTQSVYHAARSEYLLWRPVKGNSHVELTMGHDIRQICYDVKNLIEYARTHRAKTPSLPRMH